MALHPRVPRALRLAAWAGGIAAALLLIVALVVHTPPVRRAVLRRAVAVAADRVGLAISADTLRYNLLLLRATLTGVAARADGAAEPVLTADTIEITIPRSALFGPFAIERLRLDNARITIVRRADGTTNLPEPGGGDGEPAALPIGRLEIAPLAVSMRDEAQDLSLDLPAAAIDIGTDEGSVRLLRPGQLRRDATTTAITSLDGGLSFDGRVLRLRQVALATDEGRANVDGTLGLLVAEPRLDVALAGRGDLARIVRWSEEPLAATGTLAFDGTASGPFASPAVQARVRSDRLTWDALTLTDLSADVTADAAAWRLSRFAARTAGGTISATGEREAEGRITARAEWSDIDLAVWQRALAPDTPMRAVARATGTASVSGSGSTLSGWSIRSRSRLEPLAPGRNAVPVGGAIDLDLADGRWALTADATVASAPLQADLRGAIDDRRFAASSVAGTVALREVDLPSLIDGLRAAGLADVEDGAIVGGRLTADATLAGTLERPRLQVTAAARELATADVSAVDVDLTAQGTPQQLAVDARVRQGASNTALVTGTVWPEAERVAAQVAATLRDVSGLVAGVPLDGTVNLELTAEGPFDRLAATGTATVADARYQQFELGRLEAAIDVDATTARVDLTAPELNTRARAAVPRTGVRTAAIEVDVTDADLARVLRGATVPVQIAGGVSLSARADVPFDDWRRGRADLVLTRLDGTAGNLPMRLDEPARARYDGRILTVAGFEADVGETRLSVAGSLPMAAADTVAAADALRAVLTGDAEHVLEATAATGLVEVRDVVARGPLALFARVTGSFERPILAADLDVGGGEIAVRDLPPARDVQLRAQLSDGAVTLLNASATWQEASLTANGRLPIRLLADYLPAAVLAALPAATGDATLDAQARGITPAVVGPFLDPASLAQIEGVVDASLRLTATALDANAVSGEARLDRLDVRLAGLPVGQREPTRIVIGGGVARVAAWDWTGQGATLAVQGEVRLADRQAALLAAGRIDLRALTPFVSDAGVALAGTLAPRVSVVGPLADPRIDGEVALTAGEVRLREPRIVASELNAFAVMTPSGGRTTSLTGLVNGGVLDGGATLDYAGPGPWSAALSGTITGMGLEFPEGLRSELNGDVTFALRETTAGPAGSLTGTVTVARSVYREPFAVVTALLAGVRTRSLTTVVNDPDDFTRRIDLNLRLLTDSDIIVDNNLAQLELGGDLRVIGTVAQPALSGRADVREGGQLFLGRNVYTIVDPSTIDFTNPVTIEPNLNVQATTRVSGREIELRVTGTADAPSVVPTDALGELGQADVYSLLLTGRRLDEVAGAEADIVGEQVLGFLSGDVLGVAGSAVGLDTLRLGGPVSDVRRDPAAVAAETDPASRLTFGKTFGDEVEVTFSQSLRQGASTWIVDYQPLSQVELRLVSRDDNLRSYEFRHNVSIGGGDDSRRSASRPDEREIAAIAFTGDAPLVEAQLRQTAGLDVGDTFDIGEWQQARERLEAQLHGQGFLETRVASTRQEQPEGVALTFDIQTGPSTALAVTGYVLPAATRAAIEEAWTQSVFDDFLRDEAVALVRQALAADGFLQPQVSAEMTAADVKTLAITVDPGVRARNRRLTITAPDESLARELDEWVREQALDDEAWRDPRGFERTLAAELRARGHVNARAAVTEPRFDDSTAVLVVNIEAGAPYVLASIVLPAGAPVREDVLRDAAALTPGTPYDPSAVDGARDRILRAYRRDGFVGARVEVKPAVDDVARTVTVHVTADEGPRDVLRAVEIRGHRSVDEDVIARALDLEVGEPLGAEDWLQARSRVFDTALFRRVDVTAEPFEDVGVRAPDERPMRVIVTVQEWPALRLRYGFQLSEERPETEIDGRELSPGLSADITRRTLFGRAVTVGAAAEYQRRQRLGRIFASAPTLAGLPVESLLTLERSRETFTDDAFVTDRSGISWEQKLRIGTPLRISYGYRFERNHTFETGPPNPFVGPIDITINVARISTASVFDTRNDPTDATRGSLFSFNLEHAPTTLGSDVRFLRHVTQAYRFQPWGPVVLASAARVGMAMGHGGQEVILSERFFAGGARSVRGVAEDSLGPRDIFGDVAGGEGMLVLNQELRFPIAWRFRGVAFLDAGNVFDRPSSIDFSGLVGSVGGGLRVVTPIGLLRVDFARPAWGLSGATGRWHFGIGQAF